MTKPKKCPSCNSTRLRGNDKLFRCEKCGYVFKKEYKQEVLDEFSKSP